MIETGHHVFTPNNRCMTGAIPPADSERMVEGPWRLEDWLNHFSNERKLSRQ